ncbi:MAG: carbohydrate ABC transporter permease [Cellulomonas sp.]|uniref:carbohydrate ABC transporter permease n=1 Tax=Cellulomonas sp. 73-92 TaxID=1895740 RepID=UPI000926370B|nr:carbohydrate ABC transporter permease [Cellulomonas sp. 73-92]MBN9373896.1 carbohydrate ABC transporter permease [Cellulomonas sp.]OJV78844.1 MAG: sugar ABC transporter permease [Cellulomonas sp. 73-92]
MFELRRRSSRVILQVVLFLLTVPFLLPLVQMVIGALGGIGWRNFVVVWDTGVIPTFFRNSAILAASVIAIVYVLSMTASFGFSKLHIFGKEVYFWLMLAALTLPEVILLSPLFVTATQLHLYNTLTAVVLPLAALQLPFVILLTRNYFDGIPTELIDAGRIDGASVVQTFWHIVLPLTRPIASAVVVLTLINSWNSYLLPLVFLQDRSRQVVTLLPQFFVGEYTNDQTKILAAAVMTAVPTVLAYVLMQKNFERGLSAGALK